MHDVNNIKRSLSSGFEMKDLRKAKRIFGMDIIRNRSKNVVILIQTSYVEKVLSKFSMHDSKTMTLPLVSHFKPSKDQCPIDEFDIR